MKKRLRKGKLLALLVVVCAVTKLSAQSSDTYMASSKTVAPQQSKTTYQLVELIKELEKTHNVIFDYRKNVLKNKSVKLSKEELESATLPQLLNVILPPLGLQFKKYNERSYLIYSPKEEAALKSSSFNEPAPADTELRMESDRATGTLVAVDFTVAGVVKNESGETMPGVNIVWKGTSTGTVTDTQGRYTLNLPNGDGILVFSFIGYTTIEEPVNNRSVIEIVLQPDVASLDEVVVIGYGTQKKSDLTGSIGSVSDKDFRQQPVTRVDQALQGRVAGVQVINAGGAPGGDVRIRVRGANSLSGDNDPLYVIDGFVGADFNIVNPNDIESIEVLKDASATAIYGSRGANGVIIITTKSGKQGEMKLDFGARFYSSQLLQKWNTLNAGDFAQVANERALAAGGGPKFTDAQIAQFRANGGTDWQDEIFNTAPGMEYQLGISGGNDKVKYLISGNVLDQDGILNNTGFKRYTLRSNINADLTEKLSARFIFGGSRRENLNTSGTAARGGAVAQALAWAPTTPVRHADGSYVLKDPTSSLFANPVAITTENETRQERTNATILTGLNYEIIDGLSVDVQLGLNYTNRQDKYYWGDLSADTDIAGAGRASAEDVSWQSTNMLNYRKTFGIHAIDITGVFEAQEMVSTGFGVNVNNLTYPANKYDNLALSESSAVNSGYSRWALLSLLGRVNYTLKDRYLFSAAIRRDGSSKFRGSNQYSVFPSFAAGWRISEETFMQPVSFINALKLRASWGLTGAQGINPYGTMSAYSSNIDDAAAVFDGTTPSVITSGIIMANPGNPNLKWETTEQIDVGMDLEVLEGRVSLSVDYFRKETSDLHLLRALPGYAGGYSIQSNIGANQNTGFEVVIGATPIRTKDFTWTTSLNFSTLKNKITGLGNDRDTIPLSVGDAVLITGQPMSSMWGYRYLGTYKPDEADLAAQYGRTPGDARYDDTNNDGIINSRDYQVIGHGIPRTSLGFNNTFTYKNFALNIFLQGLFDFDKQNYTYAYGMIGSTDAKEIIIDDIKDRYIPGVNETSDIPKFGGHPLNSEPRSSRFIEKGDFLRLKNLSLAYTLSRAKLNNVADVRIFVSGTNLVTFTNYKGIDPESNSNAVSGLTWDNFNTDAQLGLDYGSYPNSKTYTIGFNITF